MMKGNNILVSAPPLARWCMLMVGAALVAFLPRSHAATFTYQNPTCSSYTVSGSPPNQTVTCSTSSGATPACAPTVSPTSPAIGQTATITANCSNQPTSYTWTGGGCSAIGATTSCSVTKSRATTVLFTISGTNGAGTGSAAQISVTWH
jgi:hypothetical protein